MQDRPWEAPSEVTFAYIEEPPFAMENDGVATGSDVDLARRVLETMGVTKVVTRKVEFSDLLPGVAAGQWTINTALFITPERCRDVAFSDPVWALGDALIVRRGNPRKLTSYAAIAADPQARLGVMRGTVQAEDALREGLPNERLLQWGAQDEVLAAIRDGRVDAYSATALGQRTLLAKLGASDLELARQVEPPSPDGHVAARFGAFSFAKSDLAFVSRFNMALATYLGASDHRAMMSSYGFTGAEIDPAITMRGRLGELCSEG